jgi:hypothetical protein
MEYFILRKGKPKGPFARSQIEAGIKQGKLRDADFISTASNGPWKTIKQSFFVDSIGSKRSPFDSSVDNVDTQQSLQLEVHTTLEDSEIENPPHLPVPTSENCSRLPPTIDLGIDSLIPPPLQRIAETVSSGPNELNVTLSCSTRSVNKSDRMVPWILGIIASGAVLIGLLSNLFSVSRNSPFASVASPFAPIQRVKQSEVDSVLIQTETDDISSENVNQQIACYSRGAMKMASLLALSYGADSSAIDTTLHEIKIDEIGTTTVFQQKAVYFQGMMKFLAIASRSAGSPEFKIESALSQVRVAEIGSKTVHQQCVNYSKGCLKLVELIAIQEGASQVQIQLIQSAVSQSDITAETVYQQQVAQLTGICKMLVIAAKSRGVESSKTSDALLDIERADLSAKTVFQQEVNRLIGIMKLLGSLAVGR